MDNIILTKTGNLLAIKTINEEHVKKIGLNALSIGGYQGFLSVLFGKEVKYKKAVLNGNICIYEYELTNNKIKPKHHSKEIYLKSNKLPNLKGFSLKDALKMKIFQLKKNNVYFRNKKISPLENTFFHLLSNKKILLREVTRISKKYFQEVFEKKSRPEEKLRLLKTLLQVMGWGVIKIKFEKKGIVVKIDYPPHGLQLEGDNWSFLARTIEGCLQNISGEIKLKKFEYKNKSLIITYSN